MSNAYFYAQIDANNVVIAVSQLSGEVTAPNMISIATYDTSLLGSVRQASGTFVKPTPPPPSLADAKTTKLTGFASSRDSAIYSTFTSSALGPVKTYGYSVKAADNFRAETALLALDTTITSVNWATIEDGFISHTRAQFTQVVRDGSTQDRTLQMRYYTKEAQVNASTTQAQLDTVAWPKNPNAPTVPTGLKATAGIAGSGKVDLSWTANTDVTMIGGGGYNVYVDGAVTHVNTAIITVTTFSVTSLAAGSHTFQITSVDTDGTESAKCTPITATL